MEDHDVKFQTLDFPIKMGECGPDGTIRSHIWFDFLQHIAAVHADKLGFGMTDLIEKKMIWVLSRLKLHLDSTPRYDDIVRVETYHNGTEKIFAKRQFILSSAKSGERFGYASSFWLCLELPSFRPRPPAAALGLKKDENLGREEFYPMIGKIDTVEGSDPLTHYVSASHIDLNDHLNNTYYVEYTLDWIGRKTGKLVHFDEIQINFNRAMQFGEDLIVTGTLDGNRFHVEGIDRESGKNSFQAEGIFREIRKGI